MAEQTAEIVETKPAEAVAHSRSMIGEFALTIVLLLFGTTTLIQSFVIPTVSMEDTLLRGDHLLVDKMAYAPAGILSKYVLPYQQVRRGDIIVFRWPLDIRQNYVKRVIGIPGDRLKIVRKELYLNGRAVIEPYKVHKSAIFDWYRDYFPGVPNVQLPEPAIQMLDHSVVNSELVVPPDNYFVMGDNRDNSLDSRYWGFVPRANIIGKPLLVFWSYDAPTDQLANPNLISGAHLKDLATNFFTKTRWSRTCRLIRAFPLE